MIKRVSAFAALLLAGSASLALAQTPVPQPQPAPASPPIVAAKDTPYPGTLTIRVDATDLDRHIFRIAETVPVAGPGPLTLLYPSWIPGEHSQNDAMQDFAGLIIRANGQVLPWTRDPVEANAFHIDVPQGAKTLEISFQYLSPVERSEGRVVMTPNMLNLEWWMMALYPAGHYTRDIMTAPSVKLPESWHYATALETASADGGVVHFKPVNFETLVDSPLDAGRYFVREDLSPNGPAPVHLDVFGDSPDLLTITPDQLAVHRNLVTQAYKLFDSHHYDHYDFLFSLSDQMGGQGLEHHQSSEDGTVPGYFVEWDKTSAERDLLAHEFTHSWNGKFRRPADLWTETFNTPMRDSLLWMYEGQTQYWGYVLAARSGLWTHQQALDAIADTAATYDAHVGHEWRPIEDTTNDPIIAHRSPLPWRNYQLSEDYYSMGQLTWLDADTLIRKLTNGQKSLDDFAKAFFGVDNGSFVTHTYTFDDIVRTLNQVVPYDWAKFLHQRIYEPGKGAPLDGITRGGYKLVFTDKQTPFGESVETVHHVTDFLYSLGFSVGKGDELVNVQWGSPAFQAGLTAGTKLVALNGAAYDNEKLKRALDWAVTHKEPLTLIVEQNKSFRTVSIDYHGGQRFPHLVPDGNGPHSLDAILAVK